MNKTLPMTLLALAMLALAATPTASACQYYGPAAETVNYALYCSGDFGVVDDANSIVAFAIQEAGHVVEFVVEFVLGLPLP